ncbi:hemerythrin domain-containing protein [Microlunatus flavus]|uniref:Hemerythrin HHE cation binding domain-containing protein n=1 Tax=Microlunatus flavus TaxID=1036181 RepID=A0A1H9IXM3_9ACTN|nr:hemerythrin domain-containing protein [Microlunatus flavus]SEQ79248.1 Hemerythrin HHE cation binding domain-containing protein [Microlunatus flavus]
MTSHLPDRDAVDLPTDDASTGHTHTARCYWDLHRATWSCGPATGLDLAPPAAPAAEPERPLVDVRDMVVVHTALLRELRLAPAAVLRVGTGDRRGAERVAAHVLFLTDLLHHHHQGEDRLLWPPLRERASADAVALIDEVEEQHAGLDLELGCVERFRVAWAAEPTPGARDQLAHHLGHLHALLAEHLDLEERALLPLAAALLTQAEWGAVGEAGAAGVAKRHLPLVFGMFAYEGDPAVVAAMLGAAPRLARVVIPPVARSAYARRARRVHGTSRP